MIRALSLWHDGQAHLERLPDEPLADLQQTVGGYIEAVTLRPDITLWCNEEGKLDGLPVNHAATHVARGLLPYFPDVIVGDVVLTGGAGPEGETLGLSDTATIDLAMLISQTAARPSGWCGDLSSDTV